MGQKRTRILVNFRSASSQKQPFWKPTTHVHTAPICQTPFQSVALYTQRQRDCKTLQIDGKINGQPGLFLGEYDSLKVIIVILLLLIVLLLAWCSRAFDEGQQEAGSILAFTTCVMDRSDAAIAASQQDAAGMIDLMKWTAIVNEAMERVHKPEQYLDARPLGENAADSYTRDIVAGIENCATTSQLSNEHRRALGLRPTP